MGTISRNNKLKHVLFLAIFAAILLSTSDVMAQFFTTGENPGRVKWCSIKTENYKIIYPVEIDSLAQRYAWLLEKERSKVMAGLKINPKPMPVILSPYTTLSNGTVAWAPKRMELYTLPPANRGYAQNWERQLVLHESRHVGQMTNFTKGVFKPLSWILGEQMVGAAAGIYTGKWLLEGDAVVAETELSKAGRGRTASFMEYYRASFLEGKYRSWEKWRYGSFRQYYPDHYAFGYLLNSAMRMKSNNYLAAGDLFEAYVKRFYNPMVHSAAMKDITGYSQKQLFKAGAKMYTEMWQRDYDSRGEFTTPVEIAHKSGRYHYEYTNTLEVGKDSLVFIKYSNDNASELVLVSWDKEFLKRYKKGEKLLRIMSRSADGLAVNGKTLYWIESVADNRWGKQVYNILFAYNLESGKVTRLSNRSSYNNPMANNSGEFLSVVEYPYTGGSNISVLNSQTGEKVISVSAPHNGQFTESTWIGDTLYSLVITDKGLGMYAADMGKYLDKAKESEGEIINVGDDCWRVVLSEQMKNIASLGSEGDCLYFESDMDGVNNIYLLNPKTEELKRLTNSKYAAHYPFYSNGRLYYTELRLNGNMPVYTDVQDAENSKGIVTPVVRDSRLENTYEFAIAETLTRQADNYFTAHGIESADSLQPSFRYKSKPYRKGAHLFHFHSWAPLYYNADKIMSLSYDHFYEMATLGLTAYSQNSLGTATTMLGYSFREGHHAGHISFEYSGLYPVFKISAHYNETDRLKYRIDERDGDVDVNVFSNGEPLFELDALAYVPINLSSNGWNRGLIPQLQWSFENNAFYSKRKDKYENRQQLMLALQFYQVQRVATAEIFPKWGIGAVAKAAFTPNGKENFGKAASIYGYLYMPGILNCQGIKLSAAYQRQFVDGKWLYLDNLVEMPRGGDDFYGSHYYKYSVDYAVPVNFNGLNFGWFAYIKRMQIIPFADFAAVQDSKGSWKQVSSYGCDLLLDGVVFHIGVPVSFGLRYSRTSYGTNHIGILTSMSLF